MKNDKWNVDEMFDKEFDKGIFGYCADIKEQEIKKFIHTALSKQAEKMLSKMPSEKEYEFGKESIDDNVDGFNEALSETKKIIEEYIK